MTRHDLQRCINLPIVRTYLEDIGEGRQHIATIVNYCRQLEAGGYSPPPVATIARLGGELMTNCQRDMGHLFRDALLAQPYWLQIPLLQDDNKSKSEWVAGLNLYCSQRGFEGPHPHPEGTHPKQMALHVCQGSARPRSGCV
jgi:hypothetical protein